jgi:A/G-specific adenine glycosylase
VQDRLLAWYRESGRDLPWRRTRDPYHILVAEVMLQQTQVDRVLPKYARWLGAFPTLAALAAAPTAEVIRLWAPLGYNSRAVRLQQIARQCQGSLPATFEGLLALKGIGRYTAGAVACYAYEQQVTFWDTNVRRTLTRLFSGPEPLTERELEALAEAVLPAGRAYDWHQALMDLGATVCLSRGPRCDRCPAMDLCAAHPAILFGEPRTRMVAERKAPYRAQPFETTDRYFRGRIVDALRAESPLAVSRLPGLLGRDEPDWLQRLLATLQKDGLLVRQAVDWIALPI